MKNINKNTMKVGTINAAARRAYNHTMRTAIAAAIAAAGNVSAKRANTIARKTRESIAPIARINAERAARINGADRLRQYRAAWTAEREYMAEHTRRARQYIIVTPAPAAGSLTDAAAAAINAAAVRMAFTAIKTAYANSADKYLLRLMQSAPADIRALAYDDSRADAAAIAAPAKLKTRYKLRGVWRAERRPYMTITAADAARINAAPIAQSTEFSDCVSIARTTLVELAAAGAIPDFDSLWNFSRLVYAAVNKYVHSQRARRAEYSAAAAERAARAADAAAAAELAAVTADAAAAAIVNYLRAALPSKANKDNITAAVTMRAAGMTEKEIGDTLGVSDRAVRKYLDTARRHMETPQGLLYLRTEIYG